MTATRSLEQVVEYVGRLILIYIDRRGWAATRTEGASYRDLAWCATIETAVQHETGQPVALTDAEMCRVVGIQSGAYGRMCRFDEKDDHGVMRNVLRRVFTCEWHPGAVLRNGYGGDGWLRPFWDEKQVPILPTEQNVTA